MGQFVLKKKVLSSRQKQILQLIIKPSNYNLITHGEFSFITTTY